VTLRIGTFAVPHVAVLAPMAGITDLNFRLLCKEERCGLVYTELVSAEGLLREVRGSVRLVETTPAERPVGVQLYGHDPHRLAEAARWVEEHVPCDLIDLNMGCPVPKVVTKGAGAALMREPKKVEALVGAVVRAVQLPVTAKTRSGWDERDINAVDVARAIEAGGGACIALHARTRAQRHEGPVDWELLAEVKRAVTVPVIGNGGVTDWRIALRMREETGVDAVMIGRGAIGNPWIFRQVDDAWNGRPVGEPSFQERRDTVARHVRGSVETFVRWADRARERVEAERRGVAFVRGHLARYVSGFEGAAAFRRQMNDLETAEGVIEAICDLWSPEAEERHRDGLSLHPWGPRETLLPSEDGPTL
jgi:nifR3 family TIM-barrel protein